METKKQQNRLAALGCVTVVIVAIAAYYLFWELPVYLFNLIF